MGLFDFLRRRRGVSVFELNKSVVLRHMEIVKDCENLINTSKNFEAVLRRSEDLLEELHIISTYEDTLGSDFIARCGLTFKREGETFSSMLEEIQSDLPGVLCYAVDRCLDAEIDSALKLKTKSGQEKRIINWINKIKCLDRVPLKTLQHIESLPVLDALREPSLTVTCPACSHEFRVRPHAYRNYIVYCPQCDREFKADIPNHK